MFEKCCVDNYASKRQDIKLHQFPASEMGPHKRFQCINSDISDRLHNLSILELQKEFICHKNFERRIVTDKNQVLLGDYPTLFSEEEIQSGDLSVIYEANVIEHINFYQCYDRHQQHADHSCAKSSCSEPIGHATRGKARAGSVSARDGASQGRATRGVARPGSVSTTYGTCRGRAARGVARAGSVSAPCGVSRGCASRGVARAGSVSAPCGVSRGCASRGVARAGSVSAPCGVSRRCASRGVARAGSVSAPCGVSRGCASRGVARAGSVSAPCGVSRGCAALGVACAGSDSAPYGVSH